MATTFSCDGTGEDRLDGGRGNNTYLFNPGDGHDTIFAFDPTLGKHSMIRFGEGITEDQIVAERIGMSLRLSISKQPGQPANRELL
ncbi:hypothetical protein LP419_11495 [Massilia sp. H-1]|nr:hypothetical protein LP419_11495 [Massilia sp. H-1]